MIYRKRSKGGVNTGPSYPKPNFLKRPAGQSPLAAGRMRSRSRLERERDSIVRKIRQLDGEISSAERWCFTRRIQIASLTRAATTTAKWLGYEIERLKKSLTQLERLVGKATE